MNNKSGLLDLIKTRVLVADGAMGTMIQRFDLSLDDFNGLEGCNEILNETKPEIIEQIHLEYFEAGSDAVETNSFGCNLANLAEYGIEDQIFELSRLSSVIARKAADQINGNRFVIGSIGPGTKLPSLGHTDFKTLFDAYSLNSRGLLEGGADALLIETAQDLLQAKAAILAALSEIEKLGLSIPVIASITVEQNGTMLLGSEVPAAIAGLVSLGIAGIGMNCATGPEEMSEHLRTISETVSIPISCMPNAGLPILVDGAASYPLAAEPFAAYMQRFINDFGIGIIGGCCGTTPAHIRELTKFKTVDLSRKNTDWDDSVSSLYQAVTIKQDSTYLNIGERANANGSRAFKAALLAENYDECIDIAKNQIRSGAHVIDLCIDYVGRDGVKDMIEIASRLATSSTLPVMLDSTEPAVIQAGLELLGGRCFINSLNYEDGDEEGSRFHSMLQLAKKHGAAVVALTIDEEGQARTSDWKVRVADRLIERLRREGFADTSILIDCLTFPIATGQEETRRDGLETLDAIRMLKNKYPNVRTVLGLSNISFGLNPATRQALNSVFLSEAVLAGLDAAIVDSAKIVPLNQISDENYQLLLDLIYDRRTWDGDKNLTHDPLAAVLNSFAGTTEIAGSGSRLKDIASLPIEEVLKIRIIEGLGKGLVEDLDLALEKYNSLEIVNDHLLPAMKEVGDLFGAGIMQLPFVLQSAETMKTAVQHLEKFMEKSDDQGKGKILLATVKGDVHDIGKNLVDIILTNNGYTVVNIGIKQTIQQIIDAGIDSDVDVIGMSGLLVKSTVIMRENLEELNIRELAKRFPVILGGAALTRSYVEDDLASLYQGTVRYAKDAFEGLSLVESIISEKHSGISTLPALKQRAHKKTIDIEPEIDFKRSDIAADNQVPEMPFFGTKIVKGIALQEVAGWLDERATFVGQWGLKPARDGSRSLEDLIEKEAKPKLRYWLDEISTKGLNELAVVYGYFPAYSRKNSIILLDEARSKEIAQFSFPRQSYGERLCLADYVKSQESLEQDFVGFHIVTMGNRISEYTNQLFEQNKYRDYLELHGLSVQLTEALAEMWHSRIRQEMGISGGDSKVFSEILKQEYIGERFSFGYPACPDLALQEPLVSLMKPERIGVTLSEEFQLHPEQSTSAIIFHHPAARYFNAR
jgi:5-methyltetrahydrofolate--homocysteine methyltransferase